MNEREKLINELQTVQFALVDLGLYLDSHPDCVEALKLHKELSARQNEIKSLYEQSFGALIPGGSANTDYWDWVATPFPWEMC